MTEQWSRAHRRITLAFLYMIWALWGVYSALLSLDIVHPESAEQVHNGVLLIFALSTQLGLMWFCSVDATFMGRRLLRLAKIGIFLGWPIGVPIYAIWARGFLRGLRMVLLHAFLLALTSVAAGALTVIISVVWFAK